MLRQVRDFFIGRFVAPFKAFSPSLKIGATLLCTLLGYGVILDAVRYGNNQTLFFSVIIAFLFPLLTIEAISWLEFRGVELFNYGSDHKSQLRDKWLGRFFIRLLLVIGNVALLYKAIYP